MATFERAQSFVEPDEFAVVDRRWPHWGPAKDPFCDPFGKVPADELDEHLYRLPEGPRFAIVWHHPELLPGELVYQVVDDKRALDWFFAQGIDPPDDLRAHLNFLGVEKSDDNERPNESAKTNEPGRRIPVFDRQGKYVASFDLADALGVWEDHVYSDNDPIERALLRLADARYVYCEWNLSPQREDAPPSAELLSAAEAVERTCNAGKEPSDEMLDDADNERRTNQASEQPSSKPTFAAWFIEAHYAKDPRTVYKIDRRWPHWGPSTRPVSNSGYLCISVEAIDERMYQTPDGEFVLVWRADELRKYYECDYQNANEAEAWFLRQGIERPNEPSFRLKATNAKQANAVAIAINGRPKETLEYVALWELGRRVSTALDDLQVAVCNLVDFESEILDVSEDSLAKVATGALRLKKCCDLDDSDALLPVAPAGADKLADAIYAIRAHTKKLILEVGLSRANEFSFWQGMHKKLWACSDGLGKGIAELEAVPEMHDVIYAEALRKIQELQTKAAYDQPRQPGDYVELPNGDIGFVEWASFPTPERTNDQDEPPTEAAVKPASATASLPSDDGTTVESANDAYVEASKLFPTYGFLDYKDFKRWLDTSDVKNERRGQRRMVHAADLARAIAERDRKADEAMGIADDILSGVGERADAIRRKKVGKK